MLKLMHLLQPRKLLKQSIRSDIKGASEKYASPETLQKGGGYATGGEV